MCTGTPRVRGGVCILGVLSDFDSRREERDLLRLFLLFGNTFSPGHALLKLARLHRGRGDNDKAFFIQQNSDDTKYSKYYNSKYYNNSSND